MSESEITAWLGTPQDAVIAMLRDMVDIDSGSYNKYRHRRGRRRHPASHDATDPGFKIDGEFTGGCADSGFTAALGAATICAVGWFGGKAHSPRSSCA